MTDYYQRRGDTLPIIAATLTDRDGVAVDLTAATAIRFKMRNRSTGVTKVNAAATFVSKAAGTVSYTWIAADLDTSGAFEAEWEVAFGTAIMTWPKPGYVQIIIDDDVV